MALDIISTILKNSNYKLTQFDSDKIKALEKRIIEKNTKYFVTCLIRKKEIRLTPEEIVRQLYLDKLITEYGYDQEQFDVQSEVTMGSSGKRADIVIYEKERPSQAYIIVELKSPANPTAKEGKKQLESYCKFSGASIGVWTDGHEAEYYFKQENPKTKTTYLEKLSYLPRADQTLSEVLNVRYTIKQLMQNDKLKDRTLKDIILEFEDIVLANSGVDSFEEIFKLLFTKLYDEFSSGADADNIEALIQNDINLDDIKDKKFRQLEFRNTGTETEAFKRISDLFASAQNEWNGIFEPGTKFKLSHNHLKTCVSYLQDIKLFNSNLEVVDDAFEYLVNKEQKGEKGQYFTPRYVIDMCVRMLNPKENETMIDTAAGSCGFPMHTTMYVWGKINPNKPNLFTNSSRSKKETDYVKNKIFAIDFDERSVRIGRTLNIIAGDGHSNVLKLNTLDYTRWEESTRDRAWLGIYNEGYTRLEELRQKEGSNKTFRFDLLMANPPFAGDITDDVIISTHDIAKKPDGKKVSKIGRDILFIERNLEFLKPGGRMAIVLPQGRFNNSSDKNIRNFIAEHCRILAVVGLHGNVFKPHTGTKTSVLFVQKWDAKLCPKKDDYPIFFATMQEPSKDTSGDKIYEPFNDKHGHPIVKHDLFNHDGLTKDGIAEAFIEFAKKENLSFF
ncbi:N-6 DNA methylase [Treponema primitia ZAS-2]|uniref:N-6 DNA methylase n=1 Tax=Treponema primitia (strain ATCC BAA-887 / DSM 12427 / ZAS-2) TaxID=545694 RepID=F5YQD9_TREPZ|nr:N-6 DNA methylase [Treponema primitia]AEF84895.1 N-6 DNA methylase [Treponema primitia ZAS-2]